MPQPVDIDLSIRAPEQHGFDNPLVELNPKRLSAWLKQLPLLNLAASVKELQDALEPFNEQAMPAKTRLRLLELYREAVGGIYDAAEDRHLRSLPIHSVQRERIKVQAGELCRSLADGYRVLVRDGIQSATRPDKSPALLLATYRAVQATILTLVHSFRSYRDVPAGVYADLYRLYVYAEQAGVLEMPVSFGKQVVDSAGIGPLFKAALMLSVANPFQLREGWAVKLFEHLQAYAGTCRLNELNRLSTSDGLYVFDLGADRAPRAAGKLSSDAHFIAPRVLDTRPALDAVRERLKELRSASDGSRLGNEEACILEWVVPEVEKPRVRRAPRRRTLRRTWLAVGLEAIHRVVSLERDELSQAVAEAQPDVQGMVVQTEQYGQLLHPWTILNESVQGCLLACKTPRQGAMGVGEAVALTNSGAGGAEGLVDLALVRWMRNTADSGLQIGAEIIPGRPTPVVCEPLSRAHQTAVAFKGLLLSEIPALETPSSLVTPKNVYDPGGLIDLQSSHGMRRVRVGNRIEDTPYFDRFAFTPCDD